MLKNLRHLLHDDGQQLVNVAPECLGGFRHFADFLQEIIARCIAQLSSQRLARFLSCRGEWLEERVSQPGVV